LKLFGYLLTVYRLEFSVFFAETVRISTLTRPRADGKHVGLPKGCDLGQSGFILQG
jgi:hypothetical protein